MSIITTKSYSSWIERLAFNEETGEFLFQTKDGKFYQVDGIEERLAYSWLHAHSVGCFFNRHIKHSFNVWEDFNHDG